jgi:Mor family transcriptional regulator
MASNVLRMIIRTVGLPSALDLTASYAGRILRVPMKASPVHPLVVTIGQEAADHLCRQFGGQSLEIPSRRTGLREQRNNQIAREFTEGTSIKRIAHRYGISRTMVRKVLRSKNLASHGSTV